MKILLYMSIISMLFSADVVPISKTIFKTEGVSVNLKGQNFIVIELNNFGHGAGNFYAIDKQGTVWLTGPITAGAKWNRTPSGLFRIKYKKRYHMSSKYPDINGINNMDYSMFFNGGIALHKGSVINMSHGCIHINEKDVRPLFKWSRKKLPIVVTKNKYRHIVEKDLKRMGSFNKKHY